MASILISSGLGHLESLQEFSKRFPNVSSFSDSELERIWICHKDKNDIPRFEDIISRKGLNYTYLQKRVLKKIESAEYFISFLTEFKAVDIFNKLFNHFKSYLTTYIFTKCYIFYNWGINAFEPVIDHFKINEQINNYSRHLPKRKVRRMNFDVSSTFTVTNNRAKLNKVISKTSYKQSKIGLEQSADLFSEPSCCKKYLVKHVSLKLVEDAVKKSEACRNLPKKRGDPYQETFNLRKILYDERERICWPVNHILCTNDVDKLLLFIIKLPVGPGASNEGKILKEYTNWISFRNIIKVIIQNHNKINRNSGYIRILKRHLKKVKPDVSRKLIPIQKAVVCSYVIDILRKVIPIELFGCRSLQKKFFSGLVKIINGHKEQNFIWHTLLQVILEQKNNLSWCKEMSDRNIQYIMILKTFKWIVINFVFVLLKNNFYVTETGSSGFGLRFYKKSSIESASTIFFHKLLHYKHIKFIPNHHLELFTIERKWIETGEINGRDIKKKMFKTMEKNEEFRQPTASVRFMPKNDWSDEMRIISNIKKKKTKLLDVCPKTEKLSKIFGNRSARRQKKLFYFKLFLEFLVEKIGTGIKPLPNNPKLEYSWAKAMYLKDNFGKLHFVKADIANAFDSVLHDKLKEIIQENILEQKNAMQLKRIIEWKMIRGNIEKKLRLSFGNRPKENSVIINRSEYLCHDKKIPKFNFSEFVNILSQVVMEQRIRIKREVFKLIQGLAQGSAGKFSSHLCEIYYSTMDRHTFGKLITSNDSVFLRGVDDYLFISADIEKAKLFLDIVRRGIRTFNAKFNGNKLKSNLLEDVQNVAYLGLVFNFESMSVTPDYSKYLRRDLLSTMKLNDAWENIHFKKNYFLKRKIACMNSIKLQSILLNKSYNNRKTIRQIVFQACLLQSIRVLTLAKHLYQSKTKNDIVVCKVIFNSCLRVENLVTRRCDIPKKEVRWLFLFAVLNIFRKFSGQFSSLLVIIKYYLERCERGFINNGDELLLKFLVSDIEDEKNWSETKNIFTDLTISTKPFYCSKSS